MSARAASRSEILPPSSPLNIFTRVRTRSCAEKSQVSKPSAIARGLKKSSSVLTSSSEERTPLAGPVDARWAVSMDRVDGGVQRPFGPPLPSRVFRFGFRRVRTFMDGSYPLILYAVV